MALQIHIRSSCYAEKNHLPEKKSGVKKTKTLKRADIAAL